MRKVWMMVLGGLLSMVFCMSVAAQTPVLSDGASAQAILCSAV